MEPQDLRDGRPAFDPRLTARTRHRLARLIRRSATPSDRLAVEYVGPIVFCCCVLGWLMSGFGREWLIGLLLSAAATVVVQHKVTSSELKRYRDRFVEPRCLDAESRRVLWRAQRAIDTVLGSAVYADSSLSHIAGEAELSRHEWEIATQLREITKLRNVHASNSAKSAPGTSTTRVLDSHLLALRVAQEATITRVIELERYAEQVMAVDAAQQDWKNARRLSALNDEYLELVARTATDEHAVQEIISHREEAAAAERVFYDSFHQATLAAEALAFPVR
jgi:hypothetical protein